MDGNIPGIGEVVLAFAGFEGCDEVAEGLPSVLGIGLLGQAHPMLDLCGGLLDRIEVGGVFGQEPQAGFYSPEHGGDRLCLVAAEVVENDDVAGPQGRDQDLLDIGSEAFAIDRAIEDAGGGELIEAQRTQESEGLPAPLGAALRAHYRMLHGERSGFAGMAFHADCIARSSGANLPDAERAMRVVTIAAGDQTFVYAMV